MLKHREPNALTVFGLRRVEHLPPHFTTVTFDLYTSEKEITDWVWANLEGRFYFGDNYTEESSKRRINIEKIIGFERAGEASYFALILDTINSLNF